MIIKAFQNAKIESKSRFVLAGPKLVVNSEGQLCAGITIQNKTSKPESGKIKMLCRVMGIKCGEIEFDNIPPEGQKTLFLPVKLWRITPNEIDVSILLTNGGKILKFKRTMKKLRRLDVKNGVWTKYIPMTMVNYNYKKNVPVQDFDCSFSISSENNDLLIKVKVDDDNLSLLMTPKKLWESDCVELFFDLKPLDGNPDYFSRYHENCCQVVIPLTYRGSDDILVRKKNSSALALEKVIKVDIKKERARYIMTIRIPLEKVLGNIKGKSIAFSIAVNDNDNKVYKYNKTWVGVNNYKDRSGFSILYFQ